MRCILTSIWVLHPWTLVEINQKHHKILEKRKAMKKTVFSIWESTRKPCLMVFGSKYCFVFSFFHEIPINLKKIWHFEMVLIDFDWCLGSVYKCWSKYSTNSIYFNDPSIPRPMPLPDQISFVQRMLCRFHKEVFSRTGPAFHCNLEPTIGKTNFKDCTIAFMLTL